MVVEHVGGERVELGFREGARPLLGEERQGVVEDGEGAGGLGLGADGLAGVVLDAEAEGNVQELEVRGGVGEVLVCWVLVAMAFRSRVESCAELRN